MIDDVYDFYLKEFSEKNGNLVPIENNESFPFEIKRLFFVNKAPNNVTRGCHSHIKTKQILIALTGICVVECDDGKNKKEFVLNNSNKALYIPNGIWSTQIYIDNAILLVLCSDHFDESDYIREYDTFLESKNI